MNIHITDRFILSLMGQGGWIYKKIKGYQFFFFFLQEEEEKEWGRAIGYNLFTFFNEIIPSTITSINNDMSTF